MLKTIVNTGSMLGEMLLTKIGDHFKYKKPYKT